MQAELAGKALEHGRHIFIYNNLKSNQVIYSLSRSIANHDSLKQIAFTGKKSVPASIRPDAWHPLATVTFPNGYQGESAYQQLREYAKRHQLEWRQGEGEHQINKRSRVFKLMNQKANSIADIAKVLKTQEAEIKSAKEVADRARKEDEAAFQAETARARDLEREIKHVRAKLHDLFNSLNSEAQAALDSRTDNVTKEAFKAETARVRGLEQEIKHVRARTRETFVSVDSEARAALDIRMKDTTKEFESRLADVESWRVLVARIEELRKDYEQRTLTKRFSMKELQNRLEDLLKEQERLNAGHASGVHGAAVRQANFRAYGTEKDQIHQLTSQLESFRTAKKLRIVELESELYVARILQGTPKAVEIYEEHKNYISNLEAVRDALRIPKEQRKEGWQTIARHLGVDQTPLNDVQRRLDTAKAQLILTSQELQHKIKVLSEAPVRVPRKLKAALRKLTIAHAKGFEGAAGRQHVRGAASETNITKVQEQDKGAGSNSTFRKGLGRVVSQNRGDPDGDVPSMEGVKINWANVLDAELAETWPDAVLHDTIGLVKHIAPPPTDPVIRSIADRGNLELLAILEKVRYFEENLMKLEQVRGETGEVQTNGEEVATAGDAVLGVSGERQLDEGQAAASTEDIPTGAEEVQSHAQEAAPVLPDLRGVKAQLRRIMREALLVQAWREAEAKALARQEKLRDQLPLLEQSENLGPDLDPVMLERLKEKVLHPQVQVEMELVDQHIKRWIAKPPSGIKAWLQEQSRKWESALSNAKKLLRSEKHNESDTNPELLKLATEEFDRLRSKTVRRVKYFLARDLEFNPVKLVSGPLPIDYLKEAQDFVRRLEREIRINVLWNEEQKEKLEPSLEQLSAAVKRQMGRVTTQALHTSPKIWQVPRRQSQL